ncbi:DUF2752 domain-containing protein [Bizionia sp. KMM 8389]
MLPCLNKQVLGFDCMGCGLQRSALLIYHGEFLAAFKMYPAIFPLIALIAVIVLQFFIKFKHSTRTINILAITTITVIIVSFIFKLIN